MATKLQQILKKKKMRIVDLNKIIAEQNEKPITQYLVSEIVNGKRKNYNLVTLMKLCKALNVKPSDIIEDKIDVCAPRKKSRQSENIEQPVVIHDGMEYDPTNPEETISIQEKQTKENEWSDNPLSANKTLEQDEDDDFGF
jgi:DNA-binding Xre family transcriptional regulator